MEVGRKVVAGDEEAADLVPCGFDAEDDVGLRVVEESRVDGFVCGSSEYGVQEEGIERTVSIAHEKRVQHRLRAMLHRRMTLARLDLEWQRSRRALDACFVDPSREGNIDLALEAVLGRPDVLLDVERLGDCESCASGIARASVGKERFGL